MTTEIQRGTKVLYVEVQPPSIVWAGTGGYWQEVSIPNVKVVEEA